MLGEYGVRQVYKPSTIFQKTTRLSGAALRRDERPITPYFQGFGRSSHHSRSIPHRLNSTSSAASHSLFGPYSPFLLDLVQ